MLKKLVKYIKGYGKSAILAPLMVVIEVICELILPILMADIINIGIEGDGGIAYIIKTGIIMIALCIGALISGVASARFASVGSQGFCSNLRRAMFNHTQEFSFADIDRFSSASLITRMTNDVNTIQMMVNMGLRMVVRAPIMLLAALIICLRLNAKLTLILVIIVPVMGLAVGLLMRA
ncbi:MAG: ABC transporter ATP-binding protein, partial [Oscillospiraceae bacterium]|nr:ABC transporter ATP-binding protein [Oscillospiraceae bacterium]